MAKIKMTAQYITASLTETNVELLGGTRGFGGSSADDGIGLNIITRGNRLVLYRGVPPTLDELKLPAFSVNSSNGMPRASDRLIVFNYGGQYNGYSDGAFHFKETIFHTAQSSGQATWFAMLAWNGSTTLCVIVGDVSDLNGDGMIKLADTNIVSGDRYLMKGIKLRFPMEFEY